MTETRTIECDCCKKESIKLRDIDEHTWLTIFGGNVFNKNNRPRHFCPNCDLAIEDFIEYRRLMST